MNEAAVWTILVGIVTNSSCAILGCYLVLRRMSLLGDAVSHAVLPGIAVAFLLSGQVAGWPILMGAIVVGMLTALMTQTLQWLGKVPADASMGVVLTSFFAVGVLLITLAADDVDLDPGCVLYGLIELAPLDTFPWAGREVPRVLPALTVALLGTIGFVTLFWKELKIVAFDSTLASAMGIATAVVHYLLMGMVAAVTVASFEAVGSILVVAMLIVPAATAQLWSDRLARMIFLAVGVAIISAIVGYWLALYWNTSVAGMMAVAAGGQFAISVLFAPRYGLVSRWLHNLALGMRIAGEDVVAMLYRIEESSQRRAPGAAERLPGAPWRLCARAAGGGVAGWLIVPRLWQQGRIRLGESRRVVLTPQGRHEAQSLVRSHRLWEAYLGEHFDLPLDHLHEPAERVEHFIGPQMQERLAEELHQPHRDPHGREIPTPQGPE
jgi:manganese/zinc/iron transport system permease protein